MKKKIIFLLFLVTSFTVIYWYANSKKASTNNIEITIEKKTSLKEKGEPQTQTQTQTQAQIEISNHQNEKLSYEILLQDIEKGEKIDPNRIRNILTAYFEDPKLHVSSTLNFLPLYKYLNDNFQTYKHLIFELYSNSKYPNLVRVPMLEIISLNINEQGAIDVVMSIFMKTESESSLILGKSSKVLARAGIDISQKLISRYEKADDIGKRYYAMSLASLDSQESIPLIEKSMNNIHDINIKSSLIQSYSKLTSGDNFSGDGLQKIIDEVIANPSYSNTEKDVLLIQSIQGIDKAKTRESYEKLYNIARDENLRVLVRSSALDSFIDTPPDFDKIYFTGKMEDFLKYLKTSKSVQVNELEYLAPQVITIINLLKAE